MGTPDEQRSVHLGTVNNSAIGIGSGNTVTNTNTTTNHAAPPRDPAHEELLLAVRQLRADLDRLVTTDTTTVLDAELVSTEEEIEEEGRATPGRLARLRAALTAAGPSVEVLASGAAAVAAVGSLLGG
ncbi:hypothetical protein [Streptomyces agglomeratus]|uniref:hypothetical protein n=1 Tax=Streptomyces agglomeratus TaxID=285458 RepID=UPI000AC84349|nr:hypothetical protein [Streptomyces agglomeratus]